MAATRREGQSDYKISLRHTRPVREPACHKAGMALVNVAGGRALLEPDGGPR